MKARITKLLASALLLAILLAPTFAAGASYKHWQSQLQIAEEARLKRDFMKMRETLEKSAAEARELSLQNSAINSFWLAYAEMETQEHDRAIATINAELERLGPKPVANQLQILRGLLIAARASVLFDQRMYDGAMESAMQSKDVLEDVAGKYHPQLFRVHTIIGTIHAMRGNYSEAEKSLQFALRLAESRDLRVTQDTQRNVFYLNVGGPSPRGAVTVGTQLGNVYFNEGKYKQAEEVYKKTLKNAEADYGKKSPMVVAPVHGLAEVEFKQGRRKEFEKHTDRLFEITSKSPGFPTSIVHPLWERLTLEIDENNTAAANETARRIAKLFKVQNFDTSSMAAQANDLYRTNQEVDWKKAGQAQALIKRAAAEEFANQPERLGPFLGELGNFSAEHGRPDLAETSYSELVQSQRNASDKSLLIGALGKMADNKLVAGKKAEALDLYHQVTELLRQKYGDDSRVANAIDQEVALMKELGRDRAASELELKASEVRKKSAAK